MLIRSTRLGDLDVPQRLVIKFPHGLPGFPEPREFAVVPYGPDSPFFIMQAADDPDLTFVLVDPFAFFADYLVNLEDDVAQMFGVGDQNPPHILCVVTIPQNAEEMTANLMAPVLINWASGIGGQVVLEKTPFNTRHRLFPQGFKKEEAPQSGTAAAEGGVKLAGANP